MRRACARCGGVFGGRWTLHLIWCTRDEFFVCYRCWRWECQEGHGDRAGNVGTPTWQAGLAFVAFALIGAGWGPATLYDGLLIQRYADLPVTPIAALPEQGLARVQGVIVDSDAIAWGGRELSGEGGWSWIWNRADSFAIRDDTGEVNATTVRWWAVEGTPHAWGQHDVGSVYLPGDPILVIGELGGAGPDRRLEIRYASPDVFRVRPLPSLILGAWYTGLWVVWAATIVVEGRLRTQTHRAKIRFLPIVDVSRDTVPRDDSTPWRPNTGWTLRRRARVGFGVIFLSCLFPVAMLAINGFHARSDLIFGLGIATIFPGLAFFSVGWTLEAAVRPSAVAFSDRGIHLWYERPESRRLGEGFVAWSEITGVTAGGGGEFVEGVVKKESGDTGIGRLLDRENWRTLVEEWGRRRPSPSA